MNEITFMGWRVPPGFVSDGCTLAPDFGWSNACVMHDFMRRHAVVSTREADSIFRRHMVALGAPRLVAFLYWLMVRVTGPFFGATKPLPAGWAEYAVPRADTGSP